MSLVIAPLITQSLSDAFVKSMEQLILSGQLKTGERLPSERELALKMNVSRPVVHEGMVELAHLGLVTQKPRTGAVVNDYRKSGSLALLNTLLNYTSADIEPNLLASLLDMRELLEVEIARLAALNRRREHLNALTHHVQDKQKHLKNSTSELAETDFIFHHTLALASGNSVYPLLMNSFKPVIINLSTMFFTRRQIAREVFLFHCELTDAIKKRDVESSSEIMRKLIQHGREHLYLSFSNRKEGRKAEGT